MSDKDAASGNDLSDQILAKWANEEHAEFPPPTAPKRGGRFKILRLFFLGLVFMPVVLGYNWFKDDLAYYFTKGTPPADLGNLLDQYQQTRFPVDKSKKLKRRHTVKELERQPPYLAKMKHNSYVKLSGCLPHKRSTAKDVYFLICRLAPLIVRSKRSPEALIGRNVRISRAANILIQSRKLRIEDFQRYGMWSGTGRLLKLKKAQRWASKLTSFYRKDMGPQIANAYVFVDDEKPEDFFQTLLIYIAICVTFLLYFGFTVYGLVKGR